MITFLRVLEPHPDQKGDELAAIAASWRDGSEPHGIFQVEASSFEQIPGSPFAYWVSEQVRRLYATMEPFKATDRSARQGLATADDFRFLRIWSEVAADQHEQKWYAYPKGGAFMRFYADIPLVVNWFLDGREMWTNLNERGGVRSNIWMLSGTSDQFFFRPGLTYPRRMARFCPQAMPANAIISVRGSGVYTPEPIGAYLALLSSTPFDQLVKLLLGREGHPQFDNGAIDRTPIPHLPSAAIVRLNTLGHEGWNAMYAVASSGQLSRNFFAPALMQTDGHTLLDRCVAWNTRVEALDASLARIQSEIDDIAFDLYGIGGEDRRQMQEGFGSLGSSDELDDAEVEDDSYDEAEGADAVALTEALFEWTLGVALGRFDIRLATRDREPPPAPHPFDPLPVCSPGMLQGDRGFPANEAPVGYPIELPPHGILVDDPGHPWDAVTRIEAVLDVVAGDRAHAWIQEAEEILGRDLRDWLRRYGFERHLKRYSRSRRKAPLFWHLAPKTRDYGVWLYSPAATRDTFYRIQNDYVEPKLKAAERRMLELRQHAGASPAGQQRRDLASQASLVEELRAFRERIALIAPLWKPFRDDGVVLNCAVLSGLFDHHRAWQKESSKKWSELAAGKYDWAGWAMHLWPERVVKACASDRSIAIAHELEEALWEESEDGKWEPRADAEEQITTLIAQRRSPAIEAALDAFMRAG